MIELDLTQPWVIKLGQGEHPTAQLAAQELQEILAKISGLRFEPGGSLPAGASRFHLTYDSGQGDGFTWQAGKTRVNLHGEGPRGLLYAVYSFLEHLGCCWAAPGPEGQCLPNGHKFLLGQDAVSETPALAGRCLIIGHHAFMCHVEEWIIWAARNRLNTIFFHTTEGALALGAVSESQYQALKHRFLPLIHQRGMTLEHGGHGLTDKLPRELFKQLPQAFRYSQGRRTPDYNFCSSSPEALEIISRNCIDHFKAHPEVDVFHLWADDIPGGGWCECQACRRLNASEQLLTAMNAVGEALEGVNPKAHVSFIAYHDTEAVPRQVTPRRNVSLLWAPRMRCYAHPVDDPACPVNVPHYSQTLRQQVQHFSSAGKETDPKVPTGKTSVFEYYLDALLFKSALPPLPTLLQQDARHYRDAGIHTLQALMTGDYNWISPQLNPWIFARMAWDAQQPLDELVHRYSLAAYGADLRSYYYALEKAFTLALDLVPEQVHLNVSRNLNQVWEEPPSDMGDPFYAPAAVKQAKAHRNQVILELIAEAERGLSEACRQNQSTNLEKEAVNFELLSAWLQFDLQRLQLYAALTGGEPRAVCLVQLRSTRAALQSVYAWGRRNIRNPKHRINFHFIQLLHWQVRLDKIHAEIAPGGLRRCWLEMRTKLFVAMHYLRLRHLYDS